MWVAVINLMYGRKCVLIRGLSSYLPCHRLRCSDDLGNKPISNEEVNFIAKGYLSWLRYSFAEGLVQD